MANANVPVTTLARLFNLTERRIQQMARDGIIPKPEKGKYDLIGCTRAYIKYLQERAAGREVEAADAYLERARLLKAQADKTELEVKSLRKEVMPVDEVEMLVTGIVARARTKLLAMIGRCAMRLVSLRTYAEIEACLRENIYEVLTEMTQHESEQPSPIDLAEGLGVDGAAAQPEDQPVGGSVPPAE